jgi:hypothetical protein
MSVMNLLEALRDTLARVPDVNTCKIGLEPDIVPEDYPIVRIVPSAIKDGRVIGRRHVDLLIYFGMPINEAEGVEVLYAAQLAMESNLRAALYAAGGLYRETVMDEDRIEAYKLMAIRGEIEG